MNEVGGYSRYRWLVLVTACLSFVSLQINMISFAPLLKTVAGDLGVDIGEATNLMAVFLFAGAIALIIGGFLCDRLGVLVLLMIGNFFGSGAAVLMPWLGNSFNAVFALRFLEGMAVGFCVCTMAPTIAIFFPTKERGLVGGLQGTSIAVGTAIGVGIGPVIAEAAGGWRPMSAWLSICGWVALVLVIILIVSPKPQFPSEARRREGGYADEGMFKSAVAGHNTWIGVAATFCAAWCMQTVYGLTPTYLGASPEGLGFGPVVSGKLMQGVAIASIIAPVMGGIVQDKVFRSNAKPLLAAGFALCALFTYAIVLEVIVKGQATLVGALVLAGAGVALIYPAITVYVSGTYPVAIVGRILGLWLGLGAFGGAAGLFVAGLLVARSGNYQTAMTAISFTAVLGLILSLLLKRPKRNECLETMPPGTGQE